MIGLRVWMAGLVPVMACVLAACGRHPADAQAANAKPALTVDVVRLSQRVWPRAVTASGAVQAWQEASIGAEVSGLKLADVLVNVGDVVRQGQLLARLSDETVRTDLAAQRGRPRGVGGRGRLRAAVHPLCQCRALPRHR
ncbi:biotin/lipoyl-binding protein [Ralstonia pseudosolanacearum]|uniref:biotin/lipoyl-binding protein n=1 Tax=Ralstonia pseudosolanacearum TaxID=1310165 RepID=UPI003CF9BBBF